MTSKRKFEQFFAEIDCIGPGYLCPHSLRSTRRKIPRKVHFGQALQCDSNGYLLYEIGEIILDRYEVLSEIGKGGSGLVLKVYDRKLDETVVLKAVKNEEDCHGDAIKEYLMLKLVRRLDPSNKHYFVQLRDGFCSGGLVCLIFELLGPDLLNIICRFNTFTLYETRSIGLQLCDAIQFLHENKLMHNDIKPSNIALVDTKLFGDFVNPIVNTDIRVIDFGSAKSTEDIRIVATTCAYRAPESLLEKQSTYAYDIWAIGCTLFELYTGKTLFETDQEICHLAMIEQLFGSLPTHMTQNSRLFKKGKLVLDKRTKFARQLRKNLKNFDEFKCSADQEMENEFFELLKKMLTIDPAKRITAEEALQHEFFRDKKSIVKTKNPLDAVTK